MGAIGATGSVISPAAAATAGVTHFIGIAETKVVRAPDQIRTVLGSCIGIALYDCTAGIGGMAHVILPASSEGSGAPGKFADTAVDLLLEMLLEEKASKARLVAKIVGGAAMFGGGSLGGLGTRNKDAVEARLTQHHIRLEAIAVGGSKGRKMLLDPATGAVEVTVIGRPPRMI